MALLEVENLRVRYGEAEALRGVSLAVEEGECVAVVGANGAGKTSLMRALMGLVPATGNVWFDGHPLLSLSPWDRASLGIGYVPEGRRVFPQLTVSENLRIGAIRTGSRTEIAQQLERVYTIFPRLAERARQPAGTLSGGEQQMLAIGRALMSRPRLLLIDEISMGLAPVLVDQALNLIRDLNDDGLTVLLVEQNARKALQVAHRGYLLETGRIAMAAAAEELLRHPDFDLAYFGHVAARRLRRDGSSGGSEAGSGSPAALNA